jgi:putative FmdB family regulatory protein
VHYFLEAAMPVYDYLCARCGPFTEVRPMAECDLPNACPRCSDEAPRAFLTAPHFATMSKERRLAHATNERSAHAPQSLSQMKAGHGSGCACCSGKSTMRHTKRGRNGAKSFPGSRPWMISH